MRIFTVILGLALVLLQYRLWLSDQGIREVGAIAEKEDREYRDQDQACHCRCEPCCGRPETLYLRSVLSQK